MVMSSMNEVPVDGYKSEKSPKLCGNCKHVAYAVLMGQGITSPYCIGVDDSQRGRPLDPEHSCDKWGRR